MSSHADAATCEDCCGRKADLQRLGANAGQESWILPTDSEGYRYRDHLIRDGAVASTHPGRV